MTYQEDTATPNVYAPNNRAAKYVKQKPIQLKGEEVNPQLQLGTSTLPCQLTEQQDRKSAKI